MSNLPYYEPSELDKLLGIDTDDKLDRMARFLTQADFGLIDELIKTRKARGLSRAEVAERMGRTVQYVSDIECMDTDPRLSTLRRYAMAVEALVTHSVEPVQDDA